MPNVAHPSKVCQQWHTVCMSSPLTPEQQAAFDDLLPAGDRTGDLEADVVRAIQVAMQRRVTNSRNGGLMIAFAHNALRLSWRKLAPRTGMKIRTLRRWAEPPQ